MKTTNELYQSQKQTFSPNGHFAEILEELKFIVKEDYPVLFIGETGVGKGFLEKKLSKYIGQGVKYNKKYNAINCSGFSKDLIGSELFGHKKGAFTGATDNRKGLILESDNGVLFLDELGAMNPKDQSILLRVIEDKEVKPIGSNKTKNVKVRFIAATNRDETINIDKYKNKGINPDLKARFYPINVKSLKERVEDIPYLLKNFLKDSPFRAIEVEALWCLLYFNWPENVRQLEYVIKRAKIKRQVWEKKFNKMSTNDPSNEILCGFHLPDEITKEFRPTFGKFRNFKDYPEVVKPSWTILFNSNIATSFWVDWAYGYYVSVRNDTCIALPLDKKFSGRASDLGIDFTYYLDNVEYIDRILAGETISEDEIEDKRIWKLIRSKKIPTSLFDLPLGEARKEFEKIYYYKKREKHPDAGQGKLAELFGFDSTQALRDMQSRLGIKSVKKKKKKDNAK